MQDEIVMDEIFYSDRTGTMLLVGEAAVADNYFEHLKATSFFSDDLDVPSRDFEKLFISPVISVDLLWGFAIWSALYNSSAARMAIKGFLTKKIFFTDRWSVFSVDEFRTLIRAFKMWWAYPILTVLDLNMLINFIKNKDDFRLSKDIILSNLKYSTPVSLFVRFLFKIKNKDLIISYYLKDSGLAEFYKKICVRYL